MFFEDEKDNIKGSADISIQEDGTVTWEDVLNNDDDDLVIVDNVASNKPAKPKQERTSTVDLGDELQLVEDVNDEIDDQELMNILSNSPQSPSESDISSSEYDIDGRLTNTILEQNKLEEEITLTPRKSEVPSKPSSLPLLLALLFALVAGGGVYYGIQYFSDNQNLAQESIVPNQTVQHEMNNINQEMLEQRKNEENIMVVNEEQANEVQPQEDLEAKRKAEEEAKLKAEEEARQKAEEEERKKAEEREMQKRKIISVIPTGRSNPFLPISKYMTTDIPDTNVDFDRAGIPKPPESYAEKDLGTSKLMSIAVSGIMYDETKPSAIITYDNNDYFVQKGDRLDEYRVLDITKTYVTLAYNKNVYKANIGEEFKVSSQFYGSADFIPSTQGGGRQYHSIGAQTREFSGQQTLRYVSESDITINAR